MIKMEVSLNKILILLIVFSISLILVWFFHFLHVHSYVSTAQNLQNLNLSNVENIFSNVSYIEIEQNNITSIGSNAYKSGYISLSTSIFSSRNNSVYSTYPTQIVSLVFLMNSSVSAANALATTIKSSNMTFLLSGYIYNGTYSTDYMINGRTVKLYLIRSVGVFNFTSQLNSTTLKYLNMPVYEYTMLFNYSNLFCDIVAYAYTGNLSDREMFKLPEILLNKLASVQR